MRKLDVRCVRHDCTRRSAVASKVTTDNNGARAFATIRAYLATALIARIKGCRHALLKNPEHLTDKQQVGLARVAQVNKTPYRAYLLKEQFGLVFQLRGKPAIRALDAWCAWAGRCRIPAFVATLTNDGLCNALVESTNTKLRLLTP